MQTTILPDATGYGRVIRNGERLVRIAEERDSTPEERAIREVATVAESAITLLSRVTGEYYLLLLLRRDGNFGRGRFELRKAALALEKELL